MAGKDPPSKVFYHAQGGCVLGVRKSLTISGTEVAMQSLQCLSHSRQVANVQVCSSKLRVKVAGLAMPRNAR